MPTIIHHPDQIDFDKPGKHDYQVTFHLDSGWGYSLVPLTIINGTRAGSAGSNSPGLAAFGGTHGNEWEGQVAAVYPAISPPCRIETCVGVEKRVSEMTRT